MQLFKFLKSNFSTSFRLTSKTSGKVVSGRSLMHQVTSTTSSTTAVRRSTQTSPTPSTSAACLYFTPSTSSFPASSSPSSQCWSSTYHPTVARRSPCVSPSSCPSLCSCWWSLRPSLQRHLSSLWLESTSYSQWFLSLSVSSSLCLCWMSTIAPRWLTLCQSGWGLCSLECYPGWCWWGGLLTKAALHLLSQREGGALVEIRRERTA